MKDLKLFVAICGEVAKNERSFIFCVLYRSASCTAGEEAVHTVAPFPA